MLALPMFTKIFFVIGITVIVAGSVASWVLDRRAKRKAEKHRRHRLIIS